MMEALVTLIGAEMPEDAMADLLDEHYTRLWRILMHYVEQAHAKSDWSSVRQIAVDGTSARRGSRYVTNVELGTGQMQWHPPGMKAKSGHNLNRSIETRRSGCCGLINSAAKMAAIKGCPEGTINARSLGIEITGAGN
jgi:hypothetical protein